MRVGLRFYFHFGLSFRDPRRVPSSTTSTTSRASTPAATAPLRSSFITPGAATSYSLAQEK